MFLHWSVAAVWFAASSARASDPSSEPGRLITRFFRLSRRQGAPVRFAAVVTAAEPPRFVVGSSPQAAAVLSRDQVSHMGVTSAAVNGTRAERRRRTFQAAQRTSLGEARKPRRTKRASVPFRGALVGLLRRQPPEAVVSANADQSHSACQGRAPGSRSLATISRDSQIIPCKYPQC